MESNHGSSDSAGTKPGHHTDLLDKTRQAMEPSDIDQNRKVTESVENSTKRWEDDLNSYLRPTNVRSEDHDLMSRMTWLTASQKNKRWDFHGKRLGE